MANARNVRDTFTHFLADNLSYKVHQLRFDKNDPNANLPQVNAVNVTFHNTDLDVSQPSSQIVTIDILADYEIGDPSINAVGALDMAEKVYDLLTASAMISLQDYSSGTPQPVGNTKIFWNTTVKFRQVAADNYFHLSAILKLDFQFVSTWP